MDRLIESVKKHIFPIAMSVLFSARRLIVSLLEKIIAVIREYNRKAPERAKRREQQRTQRELKRAEAERQRMILQAEAAKRHAEAERNRPKTWQEIEREAIEANVARLKPSFDAEAYAKYNSIEYLRKYEALYRRGETSRIPPEIVKAIMSGSAERAVFNMLYSHKLNTGKNYPEP